MRGSVCKYTCLCVCVCKYYYSAMRKPEFCLAFRAFPQLCQYCVCGVCVTFSLNFDSFVRLKVYPSSVKQSSHLHKHQPTHLEH